MPDVEYRALTMAVTCNSCGYEWKTDPRRQVDCPTCSATAGSPCKRPSGHRCAIHAARDELAWESPDVPNCECPRSDQRPRSGQRPTTDQASLDQWS